MGIERKRRITLGDDEFGRTKLAKDDLDSEKYNRILENRMKLPVWKQTEEFLEAFKVNQTIILVGETGSGKSTQIPQIVLKAVQLENKDESKKYMIGCTQPRRVAAISVSKRVAEEMKVVLGEEVGYSIRFEDRSSSQTVLKYLTDGMLLREAMTDPLLERYKVIILDECHERSVSTDVLFGLLKQALKERPDLKLVVMSATLEAEKFKEYYSGSHLMKVPGRLHEVEISYLQNPVSDYIKTAVDKVLTIHSSEPPGDILLFLPGMKDIEKACEQITMKINKLKNSVGPALVLPLYSTLNLEAQKRIFEPTPPAARKIVVSTNIAETSVTIDGIVYVIDPGFAKHKVYDHNLRAESLLVSPISQANADQRSGRAGRTQPGKCFRLYTEKDFHDVLQRQTFPEIQRCNLVDVFLTLKKMGTEKRGCFEFLDPPAFDNVRSAIDVLTHLEALDDDGNLTKLGEIMSELPLSPEMGRMLFMSVELNCSNEILSICAMLTAPNCFLRPREAQNAADTAKAQFVDTHGDHLTLLKVYNAYKLNENESWCRKNFVNHKALKYADNVRKQLTMIMTRLELSLRSTDTYNSYYYDNIQKAILSGFFMQVAHLNSSGEYIRFKENQVVYMHPSNCLNQKRPEWVLFHEHEFTSENFIRTVTEIRGEWLCDIAPHYYHPQNFTASETMCS